MKPFNRNKNQSFKKTLSEGIKIMRRAPIQTANPKRK
jgi:hypothetical protein